MANPEHVELLRRGAAAIEQRFNAARESGRESNSASAASEAFHLRQLDLTDAELDGIDLSGAFLAFADFRGAKLNGANLSNSNLVQTNLVRAEMNDVNLEHSKLGVANLSGACLRRGTLVETDLTDCNMEETDLQNAFILSATISGAKLRRANLEKAQILNCTMGSGVILSLHDNTAERLSGGDLSGAILRESDLRGTVLRNVSIGDADFSGAICCQTSFLGLELSKALGLDSVHHAGPSTIDIETIALSAGRIPRVFLRGCGLSDDAAAFASARSDKMFLSCFISYSHDDDVFVHKLYDDLQDRGVRCWFAPKDMQPGERLRIAMDKAVGAHDRVLLVLSLASMRSQWVEHEVEAAFARERDENRTILIPLGVDDQAFGAADGWASFLRNTRNIGDFRGWSDQGVYLKALDRVVNALTIERDVRQRD